MWMVRAGEEGHLFNQFKKENMIAIGFGPVGDLSKINKPEEIRNLVEASYKQETRGKKAITASQISRFRFDFKEGDYVLTYDPSERKYLLGVIDGPYRFDISKDYHNIRNVKWKGTVPRDSLTAGARNTLGVSPRFSKPARKSKMRLLNYLKVKRLRLPHRKNSLRMS